MVELSQDVHFEVKRLSAAGNTLAGQCEFEANNLERAAKELMRACMGAGPVFCTWLTIFSQLSSEAI
jgi:hypothetical protein